MRNLAAELLELELEAARMYLARFACELVAAWWRS